MMSRDEMEAHYDETRHVNFTTRGDRWWVCEDCRGINLALAQRNYAEEEVG